PQYSWSRNAARFSRATCSRHSTSRGQRRHSMTSAFRAARADMTGDAIRGYAPVRMRRLAVAVLALLAVPASARATTFTPVWGYLNINDQAFYDANNALLPANQAFPRGQIKDAGTPDGWGVRGAISAV